MTEIPWASISPDLYERMVACLLSHIRPETRRIDGSGGDGGRDCQYETPTGIVAFEMKSFSGRMTSSRRKQVVRSLRRAALLQPVSWELIVPIDHTDKELEWFKGLGATVSFPLEWRGRTWLDLHFAERPFIASHYLGDTRRELLDLLRELREEEAGLADGVPTAMSRVQRLVDRANQLDPHYRFAITSDGKTTKVSLRPAYAGAEVDRPISLTAQFAFPTGTDEGRAKVAEFERALDFGTVVDLAGDLVPRVTLDAPAGLGGTFRGPTITIGPGRPATDEPLDLVLTLLDQADRIVSEVPIRLIPRSSGRRGTILSGSDRSRCVQADVVVDVGAAKLRITLDLNWERFVPHDFAPAARFLAEYQAPNRLVIAKPDRSQLSDPLLCPAEAPLPGPLASFVTDLAIIQASAGIVREVAGLITPADATNAARGAALLRGMECELPWTSAEVGLPASASLEVRRRMAENVISFERIIDAPVVIRVCETLYPVGRRHHVRVVARVDPASIEDLVADTLSDDVRVTLRPEAEVPAAVRLVD